MKKIMLFVSALLTMAVIASCGGASNNNSASDNQSAQESKQAPEQEQQSSDNQLIIINSTGYDFDCIMMSPSTDDKWSDLLDEDDIFENNEQATITLDNKNQKWDIRLAQDASDINDGYLEFQEIDLAGISTIELTNENGQIYYELK